MKNQDGEELHLYCVTVEHEVYVLATDEQDARTHGRDGIRDDLLDGDCRASRVGRPDYIDADWQDSIPYGERIPGHPDLTVRQIVELLKAEAPDPRQVGLPGVIP